GYPLYSHKVGTVLHTTYSYCEQEASIGKALWHQVTTAVILRQNMRQNKQSPDDAKLRKALENLQYKSCTESVTMCSATVPWGDEKPKLNQPRFRNIFVITAWNAYRDKINELGCARFARETGQQLVTFYSEDKSAAIVDPSRSPNIVEPELQQILWEFPHECTDNHPGKLTLCMGLPVMIKTNEATECCVTNGAEGIVAGWKVRPLPDNRVALDTLFIRLTSAPTSIQLEGLPENVIPISHQPLRILCKMLNDKTLTILCDQVAVIPNFAMTDFGSQGRTKPDNVVDLQNCKSHQSIYICLWKGSTYDGMIIVQGFDKQKMTGGISGSLRQ
ncbi:hypothetical protein POSPLADRAFT_1109608, partial [Postia placenta MAD-698-R-SB12]